MFGLAGLASTHAYAGEMTDALKRVMELKEQLKTRPSQPWVWAYTFRSLATRDDRYRPEMFLWLEKVYEERSFFLVLTTSVWWKPFESDSRWIAFRKKLGLPP